MIKSIAANAFRKSAVATFPRASFASASKSEFEKDVALLHSFNEAVAGKGDGRISVDDSAKLLALIKEFATDEAPYPEGRKIIVQYARKIFNWTEEADKSFKEGIRVWSQERKNAKSAAKKGL